ncbi:DUF418 domain-containing protein [Nesterenkonia halotolerans]|uniref:Membrane protein YeiB n=1 Tax=Nesterenkonia halotolerans TaxID=225325 RepID=A0ABR9J9Z2_9MICC|nr:DUF418 domain-containing protein [Nesterenkonia halotolerans]MBE1515803.1 putative membrane protein YeiB [Nesterenkonia halotolerans]
MSTEGTAAARSASHLAPRRMLALDAARGLAVIGMIAINTGPRGDDELLDLLYRVPYGRASLLFVLLGGIGLSLMTRRSRTDQGPLPWAALIWRCALLMLGGLALQSLDHGVSVILQIYALLILCSLPLLRASGRSLLAVAGLSAVVGPPLWLLVQAQTDGQFDRDPVSATEPIWEIFTDIVITGPYPMIIWAAPFVLGLWLGRQQLGLTRLSTRLILWGAVAAIGARLLSGALVQLFGEPTSHVEWQRLVSAVAHSQMPLWLISGTGSAVFVLGVCLKIHAWTRPWAGPLITLGQMALTAYIGHLLVLAFVIRPGPETMAQGALATGATVAALMAFTWLWRRRFSRGPFEVLLRLPKFRRSTP